MKARIITQLKPARVCADHPINGAGDPHGRRLGQPNFDEVKRGFPPTSGN